MSRRTRERPTVQVGTRVLVPLPWHTMEAVVIEHRGFIGVGGREMVCIQPLDPADDRGPFEVPVEELEIVAAEAPSGGRRGRAAERQAAVHLPVGAHVRVELPNSILDMEVIGDRGLVEGRQIVHVRSLDAEYVQADFEVAAEDVEVLSLPRARRGRAAA
jgi:hypothetical protein